MVCPQESSFVQILSGFVIGLVFAPFNVSVIGYVAFLILFEVFIFSRYQHLARADKYPIPLRISVFGASLLGFYIGREITKRRVQELEQGINWAEGTERTEGIEGTERIRRPGKLILKNDFLNILIDHNDRSS